MDLVFKFHCSLFPSQLLSPNDNESSTLLLIKSKNKKPVSRQVVPVESAIEIPVADSNPCAKDLNYMTCEVKIKDCLPCIFKLYKEDRFVPYMTGGVIHK